MKHWYAYKAATLQFEEQISIHNCISIVCDVTFLRIVCFQFWDGMTGQLKCMYHACRDPVTAVCFTGNKYVLNMVSLDDGPTTMCSDAFVSAK